MKTICFVKQDAGIRIYKQAKALKEKNKYKLLLICEKCDYDLLNNVFDDIIFYSFLKNKYNIFFARIVNYGFNNIFKYEEKKLKKIINTIDVDIFHAYAEPNTIPKIVIENSSVPVIYDTYDFAGVRYGVDELSKDEKNAEKFNLENADGIVMKFPEYILDYYKNLGYIINCPVLTYIDYCNEEFFFNKYLDIDNDIHLVYGGVVDPTILPVEYYGNNQYIDIAKQLIEQEIYFHIYIKPQQSKIFKNKYQDYIDLSNSSKYFKIHFGKPQGEFQREISQFHFGVFFHDFSKTKRTELFEQTSIGNRLSTYLEAGIPIIIGDNLKLNSEYIEKYDIGFKINLNDLSELKDKIKEANYEKLKENVIKTREGPLNMNNKVNRLIDFYKKIIDNFSGMETKEKK